MTETTAAAACAARVVDLTKTYGEGQARVVALDRVTADFYRGEFTAIMGASGSGKSTLMHCAAALDSATSGSVYVGGTDLSRLKDKELTRLRRDRIGFVFQSFNLVPTLTAEENILLPMSIAGRRPDPAWYDTVVRTVGLGSRLRHRPNELSGGQQQRVAVARARHQLHRRTRRPRRRGTLHPQRRGAGRPGRGRPGRADRSGRGVPDRRPGPPGDLS